MRLGPNNEIFEKWLSARAMGEFTDTVMVRIYHGGVRSMMTMGRKEEQTNIKTAKTKICMDRPSGVAKTLVGISPLLCAKEPTLYNVGHRV